MLATVPSTKGLGPDRAATRRVLYRLTETFFRRWWAYLIPVLLFVAGGVALQSRSDSGFKATGVIAVSSDSLLSNLTSIRDVSYGYDTPADFTSRQINSLLGTDSFVESVIEKAEITAAVEAGIVTPISIRQSVGAGSRGDSLVEVVALTAQPELSSRLATATIDAYVDYVVSTDVADSEDTIEFFEQQLVVYQQALDDATSALDEYVADHPGPALEFRPLDEQIEINRLTAQVTTAQQQVADTNQKMEEARLAREQAKADVNQRLRVVDEPQIPKAPEPRLKKMVLMIALFAIVGVLLGAAALVVCSAADRSVRLPEDLESRTGQPVVAVVPKARR